MLTHDELVAKMLQNPQVQAEFDRLEREEMPLLDAILSMCKEANLTQEEVARRMSVSPPVVSRPGPVNTTGRGAKR